MIGFKRLGPGKGVLTGNVKGSQFSEVLFSFVNEAIAGSIRLPERDTYYEIRNAGGGEQLLASIDVAAQGACAVCEPVSISEH